MSDQNHDMRATAREWRITMIVVGLGFLIAVAVGLYLLLRPVPETPNAAQPPARTPEQQRAFALKIAQVLCEVEVANAQGIGILPNYAKPASLPLRTKTRGRYTCVASTGVAKYAVQADVKCSMLLDPRCVSIYSVTSDDGTELFKRPEPKPAKK